MSITGSLTDFSLQEIFQLIEHGHRTGLLTISALPESQTTRSPAHYLWVSKGSIVAAANQLNQNGLVSLIGQYPWISQRVIAKLAQFCPPQQPLGLYLKSQSALQAEQLQHLFQIQIVQQMCALIQLKDAQFEFNPNAALPRLEMTGLIIPVESLRIMLQKLIWLQKLFEARKRRQERSRLVSQSENFCSLLILILDIAFFHSLKFSLFDTNNNLKNLSQVLDWCDRPYDLPKSRRREEIILSGK